MGESRRLARGFSGHPRTLQDGARYVRAALYARVSTLDQLITCLGAKNCSGQYRLRLLRAMELPEIADMIEARLTWWCWRSEANRHVAM